MTTFQNLLSRTLLTASIAASATAQAPDPNGELTCSFHASSMEITPMGLVAPADLGVVTNDPASSGWLRQLGEDLGLPPGVELDAADGGFSMFTPGDHTTFPFALCFSVDPSTAGMPGEAVHAEALGNGAANDVYAISWPAWAPMCTLAIDNPQLTQTTGPGQTDIDALRFDSHYPVFYSVDPAGAAVLSGLLGVEVTAGDILRSDAPGTPPYVFRSVYDLGLTPGDDIDALLVGPEGYLFSLTKDSPTAMAHPAVRGAGLYLNGPNVWADAAAMTLLPGDELNALACETMHAYRHTPLVEGHSCVLRTVEQPGSFAFFVGGLGPAQPFCIPNLLCLEVQPAVVLGSGIAGPDGEVRSTLLVPQGFGPFMLSSQTVLLQAGNLGAGNFIQAQARPAWGWAGCTPGAAVRGYTVVSPQGVHAVRFNNVTNSFGQPLNGDYWVYIEYRFRPSGQSGAGTPQPPVKVKVTFTNGNATVGLGHPVGSGDVFIDKAGVSLPPGE